jgi:PQQ-dependent dehydrogenase (methanol/ethanol family)
MNRAAGCFVLFFSLACQLATHERASRRAESVDASVLADVESRPGEWLSHGRDHYEQRFSPLTRITDANVGGLGLVWSFDTETDRGLEATPLVVDGAIYTTGSWSIVYAVDARTGELLWKWDPEVEPKYDDLACCDVVNRGVAAYRGKVYVGVLDGRLAALDATTGELVWEAVTVDQSKPYTITGAPRIIKGNVVIGNGGAEYGVRGYVTAYDAETGEQAWRFYTVPGDPSQSFESKAMEIAADTWSGNQWWTYGGGGTAWDSMAYDPELNLLYVGTGNGSPWNRHIRSPGGGDNLYLSSIVALNADSGELVWFYQTTPGDHWDYTATQHILLADLEIDGTLRKTLMQAPKNGFFYVLDRTDGELLSAEPYVPISWATGVDEDGRPIEKAEADYVRERTQIRPGPLGGHNWQPMSFNPDTGLVYIPVQENALFFSQDPDFVYEPGQWNTGIWDFSSNDELMEYEWPSDGHLLAWDPVAQEERWRVPYVNYWNGGTLSTAANLVFQGTATGDFVAYRATDGEALWQSWLGTGIVAAPITYELDGVQYVAVMAGWGGAFAKKARNEGRLYAFAIGGRENLPDPLELPPVEPLVQTADADTIERGGELFRVHCARCHGGGTTLPDLRYSDSGMFDLYPDILLNGALENTGMRSFEEKLDEAEAEAIRAWIVEERNEVAVAREQEPDSP